MLNFITNIDLGTIFLVGALLFLTLAFILRAVSYNSPAAQGSAILAVLLAVLGLIFILLISFNLGGTKDVIEKAEDITLNKQQQLEGNYRLILNSGIIYDIKFLSDGWVLVEEPTSNLSEVIEVVIIPNTETHGIQKIIFQLEETLIFEVTNQTSNNEELNLLDNNGNNAWLRR